MHHFDTSSFYLASPKYFYGKMGEVTKTRRTLIVPNQAIATYVTQWTYDSHNRLLEHFLKAER